MQQVRVGQKERHIFRHIGRVPLIEKDTSSLRQQALQIHFITVV